MAWQIDGWVSARGGSTQGSNFSLGAPLMAAPGDSANCKNISSTNKRYLHGRVTTTLGGEIRTKRAHNDVLGNRI